MRLEFFFFIGSTYSYLSVSRAADLARANGVELIWRPFSVRTLMLSLIHISEPTRPY